MIDEQVCLKWHLDNWADYMRHGGIGRLGYPSSAHGCVGGGYGTTFEEMVDGADYRAAQAVDAIILGLTPVESCAIHNAHGISVWRFHREPYEVILMRAYEKIEAELKQRGFWW